MKPTIQAILVAGTLISLAGLAWTAPPSPSPTPYRLELEANPATPFPFLSKFGAVKITAYPGGVRADTVWLDGFSRTGSESLTVMNPLARMFTEIPLAGITSILSKLRGDKLDPTLQSAFPLDPNILKGAVRGVPAERHRMILGGSFIDIWVTNAIPRNPQLEAVELAFIRGISPPVASIIRQLPGTPIYVELNTQRFKKVAILRLVSLQNAGNVEQDALEVGSFYLKAPFLDALWK